MKPEDILHWLHSRIMDQMQAECADASATERRAVAAWLREVAATMGHNGDRCAGCVEGIADAIERGEHIGGAP